MCQCLDIKYRKIRPASTPQYTAIRKPKRFRRVNRHTGNHLAGCQSEHNAAHVEHQQK
jgi:hypothetical protein